MMILRHAVENASVDPVTDAAILAILRGEGGNSSHLRALFGDASLSAILAAGAGAGINRSTILDAYRSARATAAAANPELDAALTEAW
ncbi:MAG: hypothetical protein U1E70_20440 [Acetobacteraceae bacterium]|nr:hypothetical protein [Pseudomonadota bacterium]